MEFHSTLILLKYQYTVNMQNLCEFVFLAKKKIPDFFTLYRSACTMPGKWAVMCLSVRGIKFASFCDFDIWFWNCSDSVVFFIFQFFTQYLFSFQYIITTTLQRN